MCILIVQFAAGELVGYLDKNYGCTETLHLVDVSEHLQHCLFSPEVCPNSSICGLIPSARLAEHLVACQRYNCPYAAVGCDYVGSSTDVAAHVKSCDHVENEDAQQSDIVLSLQSSMRSLDLVVAGLSYRLEQLEAGQTQMTALMKECQRLLAAKQLLVKAGEMKCSKMKMKSKSDSQGHPPPWRQQHFFLVGV